MRPRLRGLYLLTPEDADTARLAARCALALGGRPALLQYRSKLPDAALRREQARTVLAICRVAGVPMVVNDDLALALELGADGVHLGREDGDWAEARRALGDARLLGVTCYDDLERARSASAAGADYVAFGAIFPSPSKPQAPRAPRALLARAGRELGVPVAAIGGITLANAPLVVESGASLLAVISDVFDAADPAGRVRAYQALFSNVAPARQEFLRNDP